MAQSGGTLLERLLRAVIDAGVEGISIKELFELVVSDSHDGFVDQNRLWQDVLASQKVAFIDDVGSKALRKLGVDDILDLGLGDKRLKSRVTTAALLPSTDISWSPASGTIDTEPYTGLNTSSTILGTEVTSSRSGPKDVRQPDSSTPQKCGSNLAPYTASSEGTPLMSRKGRGRPRKNRVEEDLVFSSNTSPQSTGTSIQRRGDRTGEETAPDIEDAGGSGARHETSKYQRRLSRPHRSATKSFGRPRKAEFTSWEELQRQNGIPGVYLEDDVMPKEDRSGRKASPFANTKILRFKSGKLRDPGWLNDHRGSWQETYAELLTAVILQKQDESNFERERAEPEDKRGDTGLPSTAQTEGFTTERPLPSDPKLAMAVIHGDPGSAVRTGDLDFITGTQPLEATLEPLVVPAGVNRDQVQDYSNKRKIGDRTNQDSGVHDGSPWPKKGRIMDLDLENRTLAESPQDLGQHLPPQASSMKEKSQVPTASLKHTTMKHTNISEGNLSQSTMLPLTIGPQDHLSVFSNSDTRPAASTAPTFGTQYMSPYAPIASSVQNTHYANELTPQLSPQMTPNASVNLGEPLPGPVISLKSSPGLPQDHLLEDTSITSIFDINGSIMSAVQSGEKPSDRQEANGLLLPADGMNLQRQILDDKVSGYGNSLSHSSIQRDYDLDRISGNSLLQKSIPEREPRSSPVQDSQYNSAESFNAANTKQHDYGYGMDLEESEPKTITKSKKTQLFQANRAAKKDAAIHEARMLLLSSDIVRLASFHKNRVGNLMLSADKTVLEFFGLHQRPPEVPMFVIHISQIVEYPTTSAKGSYLMNFCFKTKEESKLNMHYFQYASTPAGSEAAALMRMKLVTAMTLQSLRDNPITSEPKDVEEKLSKPWACTKCNKRFKNDNGLSYHLTSSQTVCNPKWVPTRVDRPKTPKIPQIPKQARVRKSAGEDKTGLPPSPSRKPKKAKRNQSEEEDDRGSLSSEDSVLEWAEQVATREPAPSTSYRWYKNLPKEVLFLEELAIDVKSAVSTLEVTIKDRPVFELCTLTDFQERILELVRGNGGLFPAEKGLWIVVVSLWLKSQGPLTEPLENLPESKFCKQALDQLIDSGRLVRSTFEFKDNGKSKRIVSRSFVYEPGFDLSSPLVESFKTHTIDTLPDLYIPAQFTLPADVMKRLQTNARGINVVEQEDVPSESESLQSNARSISPVVPEVVRSGSESVSVYNSDNKEGAVIEDEDMTDGYDSNVRNPFSTSARRKRSSTNDGQNKPGHVPYNRRPRTASFKAAAAAILKARWDLARAQGLNSLHPERGLDYKPKRIRPQPQRRQEHDKIVRPKKIKMPQPANPELPRGNPSIMSVLDPTVTLWPWAPQSDPRNCLDVVMRRSREGLEAQIPAPLTFLQASNGAWSERPPGHGTDLTRIQPARSGAFPPTRRYPGSTGPSSSASLRPLDDVNGRALTSDAKSWHSWTDKRGKIREEPRTRASTINENGDGQRIANPGLSSLPRCFGLPFSSPNDNDAILEFPSRYESVQFSMLQKTTDNCEFGEGSWEYSGWLIPCGRNFNVKWRSVLNWTMSTIPYEKLHHEIEEFGLTHEPVWKDGSYAERYTTSQKHGRHHAGKILNKKRVQTAALNDFDGILASSTEASSRFGVEVSQHAIIPARANNAKGIAQMSYEVERRLIAACIAVIVLAGGLEGEVDFVLVMNIVPGFDLGFLKKYWEGIHTKHLALIDIMRQKFCNIFPLAYEAGEVPAIDYNHLVDYDWDRLLAWMMANIDLRLIRSPVHFPGNRTLLDDIYHLTELDPGREEQWKDKFFDGRNTDLQRVNSMVIGANSLVTPQTTPVGNVLHVDDFCIARSWVRATALTPNEDWNQSLAAQKLSSISLELVEEACESLVHDKIIMHRAKGRATPGRAYTATDHFRSKLHRVIPPVRFVDAMNHKRQLDVQILENKYQPIRIGKDASDGVMMCITSLEASGQIRFQTINAVEEGMPGPINGNGPPKLPTREIDLYPTSLYNHTIHDVFLNNLGSVHPPLLHESGALPIWTGITGKLNNEVWRMVVGAVSQTVAQRAGTDIKGITAVFSPVLEQWEISILMRWGEDVGLFRRLYPDVEGWTVGTSWWLGVGYVFESGTLT